MIPYGFRLLWILALTWASLGKGAHTASQYVKEMLKCRIETGKMAGPIECCPPRSLMTRCGKYYCCSSYLNCDYECMSRNGTCVSASCCKGAIDPNAKCGMNDGTVCCMSNDIQCELDIFPNVLNIMTPINTDSDYQYDEKERERYKALVFSDYAQLLRLSDGIERAARETGIDGSLLAGFISKMSRAGKRLYVRGFGPQEKWGVMQVDSHKFTPNGSPYSYLNIKQGAQILKNNHQQVKKKFPLWDKVKTFKASIGMYQIGDINKLTSYNTIESAVNGVKGFVNDIIQRAQIFKHLNFPKGVKVAYSSKSTNGGASMTLVMTQVKAKPEVPAPFIAPTATPTRPHYGSKPVGGKTKDQSVIILTSTMVPATPMSIDNSAAASASITYGLVADMSKNEITDSSTDDYIASYGGNTYNFTNLANAYSAKNLLYKGELAFNYTQWILTNYLEGVIRKISRKINLSKLRHKLRKGQYKAYQNVPIQNTSQTYVAIIYEYGRYQETAVIIFGVPDKSNNKPFVVMAPYFAILRKKDKEDITNFFNRHSIDRSNVMIIDLTVNNTVNHINNLIAPIFNKLFRTVKMNITMDIDKISSVNETVVTENAIMEISTMTLDLLNVTSSQALENSSISLISESAASNISTISQNASTAEISTVSSNAQIFTMTSLMTGVNESSSVISGNESSSIQTTEIALSLNVTTNTLETMTISQITDAKQESSSAVSIISTLEQMINQNNSVIIETSSALNIISSSESSSVITKADISVSQEAIVNVNSENVTIMTNAASLGLANITYIEPTLAQMITQNDSVATFQSSSAPSMMSSNESNTVITTANQTVFQNISEVTTDAAIQESSISFTDSTIAQRFYQNDTINTAIAYSPSTSSNELSSVMPMASLAVFQNISAISSTISDETIKTDAATLGTSYIASTESIVTLISQNDTIATVELPSSVISSNKSTLIITTVDIPVFQNISVISSENTVITTDGIIQELSIISSTKSTLAQIFGQNDSVSTSIASSASAMASTETSVRNTAEIAVFRNISTMLIASNSTTNNDSSIVLSTNGGINPQNDTIVITISEINVNTTPTNQIITIPGVTSNIIISEPLTKNPTIDVLSLVTNLPSSVYPIAINATIEATTALAIESFKNVSAISEELAPTLKPSIIMENLSLSNGSSIIIEAITLPTSRPPSTTSTISVRSDLLVNSTPSLVPIAISMSPDMPNSFDTLSHPIYTSTQNTSQIDISNTNPDTKAPLTIDTNPPYAIDDIKPLQTIVSAVQTSELPTTGSYIATTVESHLPETISTNLILPSPASNSLISQPVSSFMSLDNTQTPLFLNYSSDLSTISSKGIMPVSQSKGAISFSSDNVHEIVTSNLPIIIQNESTTLLANLSPGSSLDTTIDLKLITITNVSISQAFETVTLPKSSEDTILPNLSSEATDNSATFELSSISTISSSPLIFEANISTTDITEVLQETPLTVLNETALNASFTFPEFDDISSTLSEPTVPPTISGLLTTSSPQMTLDHLLISSSAQIPISIMEVTIDKIEVINASQSIEPSLILSKTSITTPTTKGTPAQEVATLSASTNEVPSVSESNLFLTSSLILNGDASLPTPSSNVQMSSTTSDSKLISLVDTQATTDSFVFSNGTNNDNQTILVSTSAASTIPNINLDIQTGDALSTQTSLSSSELVQLETNTKVNNITGSNMFETSTATLKALDLTNPSQKNEASITTIYVGDSSIFESSPDIIIPSTLISDKNQFKATPDLSTAPNLINTTSFMISSGSSLDSSSAKSQNVEVTSVTGITLTTESEIKAATLSTLETLSMNISVSPDVLLTVSQDITVSQGSTALETLGTDMAFIDSSTGEPLNVEMLQSQDDNKLTFAHIYELAFSTPTTGASEKTVKQFGLNVTGVAASEILIEQDFLKLKGLANVIKTVSKISHIPPELLGALISQRSRVGLVLYANYTGDFGYGLFQIAISPKYPSYSPYSYFHIKYGAVTLHNYVVMIRQTYPIFTPLQTLLGALVAYELQTLGVPSREQIDRLSLGGDLAMDVMARARWLRRMGYPDLFINDGMDYPTPLFTPVTLCPIFTSPPVASAISDIGTDTESEIGSSTSEITLVQIVTSEAESTSAISEGTSPTIGIFPVEQVSNQIVTSENVSTSVASQDSLTTSLTASELAASSGDTNIEKSPTIGPTSINVESSQMATDGGVSIEQTPDSTVATVSVSADLGPFLIVSSLTPESHVPLADSLAIKNSEEATLQGLSVGDQMVKPEKTNQDATTVISFGHGPEETVFTKDHMIMYINVDNNPRYPSTAPEVLSEAIGINTTNTILAEDSSTLSSATESDTVSIAAYDVDASLNGPAEDLSISADTKTITSARGHKKKNGYTGKNSKFYSRFDFNESAILNDIDPAAVPNLMHQNKFHRQNEYISNTLIREDIVLLSKFKEQMMASTKKTGVDPALIAALISKGSRAGRDLDRSGYGWKYKNYGLMQINPKIYGIRGGPFSNEHIKQGVGIIKRYLRMVLSTNPTKMSKEDMIKATIALWDENQRYYKGKRSIKISQLLTSPKIRRYTDDVLMRALYLNQNHFFT